MQDQLKNLVEAVRSGRGMDEAMLAAQVELLIANNPGRATPHDPATAGPDDLLRRLQITVHSCIDIAPAMYSWEQVEEICAVVIRQIAKLEPAPKPFAVTPAACGSNCQCEHCIVPNEDVMLAEIARDCDLPLQEVTDCYKNHKASQAPHNAFVDVGKSSPHFVRRVGSALTVLYSPFAHFWSDTEQCYYDGKGGAFVRVTHGLFEKDGRLTATDENFLPLSPTPVPMPKPSKPAGPPTVLVGLGCKVPQIPHSGVWKQYPADCPTAAGTYEVRLASGEHTVRDTIPNNFGAIEFPKALDPMNEVVEWLD